MTPQQQSQLTSTRRQLLQNTSTSVGALALTSLLNPSLFDATKTTPKRPAPQLPYAPKKPHFTPKAKSVIFLHMVGAPSQLDLFNHCPDLYKHDGKKMPDHLWKGLRLAFVRQQPNLMAPLWKFKKHGASGLQLSSLLPNLSTVADELCVINSLHTEQFNHAPAQLMAQTGFGRYGRPAIGAWASYGLGSLNQNLPAFVVMNTGLIAGAGNSMWGSGFLPSVYQGVEFRSKGDPVLFLSNPTGVTLADRKKTIDKINELNKIQLADIADPRIATRIAQYEMAFRMQTSVPELMDTSKEPQHIHTLYGTKPGSASFANNCLLARRLVERGVRFVQLNDQGWDHHSAIASGLPRKAKQIDQPIAALIKDLKQRGLLESTLIVIASEFGRTPMVQGVSNGGTPQPKRAGRDHHKDAFSSVFVGGGTKPGYTYGKTDEIGFHPAQDPMHINDFHATILHLLGIDHEKLTFRFQGRPYRLTDIAGKVADKLLA